MDATCQASTNPASQAANSALCCVHARHVLGQLLSNRLFALVVGTV